jgi:hypothetical protein
MCEPTYPPDRNSEQIRSSLDAHKSPHHHNPHQAIGIGTRAADGPPLG